MKERTVGLCELRSRLSECLREVKGGRIIVVTERGWPVARIVPEAESLDDRLRTPARFCGMVGGWRTPRRWLACKGSELWLTSWSRTGKLYSATMSLFEPLFDA